MSRLIDHKLFEDKLVTAHKEYSFLLTQNERGLTVFNQERFHYVIDSLNQTLAGGLTDQYTLIQNADFISALDLAAEERGVDLEPTKGVYYNGRGLWEFKSPSHRFRVDGDPSYTDGLVRLTNDYKGQGGLGVLSGWIRFECSNGLVIGEIAHKNTLRHVGDIDVYSFVCKALDRFLERFEVERVIAETLGNEAYTPAFDSQRVTSREEARAAIESTGGDLLAQILADTPDRYVSDVRRAVRENLDTAGASLWGVVQAVAEIATHRMQSTARGDARTNYSFTADTWATRQYERVHALVR